MPAPTTPCDTCALTDGALANCEPENNLKALICVYGGIPFFCHHDQDWQNPEIHRKMTAEKFRSQNFVICAGWVREIRRLKEEGVFAKGRLLRHAVAEAAIEHLAIFTSEGVDAEDKEDARLNLERLTQMLFKLEGSSR